MIEREALVGLPTLQAIKRLRKKNMPAKIAVARDSTLAWPRTENSASVRPMPSPPPSLRWSRMTTIIAAVTLTWMISSTSRQSWRKPFTASISRALLASLGCLGDSQKFVGLQAGAANQGAVDVARRQQLGGIAALHRTAIEQPHGGRLCGQTAQYLANMRVRCGHFRRGRGLAGTDRPHRLVGHHELGCRRTRRNAALELALEHRQRLAGLALGQRLADADNRHQSGPPRRLGLGAHDGVGLTAIGAAL